MVDEQELHHPFAGLLDHRRVGEDFLAVGGRKCARSLRLRRSGLHFNQAHAAVAGDGQTLVVAETRDLLTGALCDLQNRHAGFELGFDAVDLGDRHYDYSAAIAWPAKFARRLR
ncbi:hypothetical protein D3C80_1477290 [compost metagenome]